MEKRKKFAKWIGCNRFKAFSDLNEDKKKSSAKTSKFNFKFKRCKAITKTNITEIR